MTVFELAETVYWAASRTETYVGFASIALTIFVAVCPAAITKSAPAVKIPTEPPGVNINCTGSPGIRLSGLGSKINGFEIELLKLWENAGECVGPDMLLNVRYVGKL
jgi:hypothetical protein